MKTNSSKKKNNKRSVNKIKNFRLAGGLAFFGVFAVIGILFLVLSHASGNDSLTLSPTSGTYPVGATLTVTVNEDSTDAINAVEADLTYNSSQLQFSSASCSSTFSLTGSASGSGGTVKLACAAQNVSETGSKTVGTVSFTVLTGGVSSTISFASTSAVIDQSTDVNSWDGTTTGGTYTLEAAAPTVSMTAPAGSSTIYGDNVNLTANASSANGIAKVEFLINGSIFATDTTSPYSATWSTLSGYPNGSYTLTATAIDNDNLSTTSSAVTVKVDNGDVNGDGTVNISDLSILAANWDKTFGAVGKDLGSPTTFAQGDLNEDNTVNISDLSILASNWGATD